MIAYQDLGSDSGIVSSEICTDVLTSSGSTTKAPYVMKLETTVAQVVQEPVHFYKIYLFLPIRLALTKTCQPECSAEGLLTKKRKNYRNFPSRIL